MTRTILAIVLLISSMSAIAFGEVGQWSSGWGQGVSEYIAVVSDGNSLYIACSDDSPVAMTLTVNGFEYGSNSKNGFNLVIDGKEIQTPYDTSYRVGANNFNYAWAALRQAKNMLAITTDGKRLSLPTKGAFHVLPALGKTGYWCRTEF